MTSNRIFTSSKPVTSPAADELQALRDRLRETGRPHLIEPSGTNAVNLSAETDVLDELGATIPKGTLNIYGYDLRTFNALILFNPFCGLDVQNGTEKIPARLTVPARPLAVHILGADRTGHPSTPAMEASLFIRLLARNEPMVRLRRGQPQIQALGHWVNLKLAGLTPDPPRTVRHQQRTYTFEQVLMTHPPHWDPRLYPRRTLN